MCEPGPLVRLERTASDLLAGQVMITGAMSRAQDPLLVVTLPHQPRHPLSSPQTLPQLLCASLGFSPWQLSACHLDAPVAGPSGPQPHSSSHLHACLWTLSLTPPPTIDHAHHSPLLCLASSERSWSPSAQHSPAACATTCAPQPPARSSLGAVGSLLLPSQAQMPHTLQKAPLTPGTAFQPLVPRHPLL